MRPYRTDVVGAGRAVEEGTPLSLMCRTWGARPAAVITWFNGSRPFSEQPAGQVALQVRLYFNLFWDNVPQSHFAFNFISFNLFATSELPKYSNLNSQNLCFDSFQ